jgi:hypothetical protein
MAITPSQRGVFPRLMSALEDEFAKHVAIVRERIRDGKWSSHKPAFQKVTKAERSKISSHDFPPRRSE